MGLWGEETDEPGVPGHRYADHDEGGDGEVEREIPAFKVDVACSLPSRGIDGANEPFRYQ